LKTPQKRLRTRPEILPGNALEKTLVSGAAVDARNYLEMADRAIRGDRVIIARQLLDKALLAAPDNAGVVMAYGRFQLYLGEPGLALGTFQKAIQLEPGLFTANFFIGKIRLQFSMLDEARHAFRSALARNKEHIPSLLELATVQEMRGRTKRAIQLLRMALELKPGAMVASGRLAELVDKVEGPDGLNELLTDPDCKMSYRTLHVVACHLVRSGYFLNKPGYRGMIKCIQHYLNAAGITDKKEVIQIIYHSFISNLHYDICPWRELALSHCTTATFNQWVAIEGLELYREAEARGKGVILVLGHFWPCWVAHLALDRVGIETTSVPYKDILGKMNLKFRNRQTFHALEGNYNSHWEHLQLIRQLKQGGTVVVSGDGYAGKDEIVLPLMGKNRGFKPGFAALAVATGAPMLPLFTSMDTAGHITVHIKPELKQRPGLARKERIKDLVVKYVDRLEAHWKAHPGNLFWLYVYKYFCRGESGF
jgi:lauroyl/myristoyl acyltransferase